MIHSLEWDKENRIRYSTLPYPNRCQPKYPIRLERNIHTKLASDTLQIQFLTVIVFSS